jgi:ligand-binding sensor domain-containing protein
MPRSTRVFPVSFSLLCMVQSAAAQAGRSWRPDERVLITAFHEVGALARDARHLYAATRGGLVRYDLTRDTWELPSTEEDGYPVNEQPTALAVDGLQADVWLGTLTGSVFRYRGVPSRWENVAFALTGQVTAIVPSMGAEHEGIWIQAGNTWFRAGRLGMGAQPVPLNQVPPAVVQRAAAQRTLDPALAAFRSSIGLDRRARRWAITAFQRGDRPEQYWFATNGAFLLRFDAVRNVSEWLWYGAATRGVSALALLGDTLWLGGDGRGARGGVVRTTLDLQSWQLFDPLEGGPSGRIEQIVVTPTELYFAGSDGTSRIPRGQTRLQRLSSQRANTVAVDGQRVWIGGRSGVVLFASGRERAILGAAISRIRVLDEQVWFAAADGLYRATTAAHPDSVQLLREGGLPATAFVDVASTGQRRFALTADALYVHDASGWRGPVRLPALRGLGRLTAIANDRDAVWIGGVNGLARYQPANEEWLYFMAPHDLPAGPLDIVPAQGHVWLATPAGALRLGWRRP